MEYRLNFIADTILQPIVSSAVEVALWLAIFASLKTETFAGFPKENYLAYALWASFVARVTANWMYEFRMVNDIETGAVNSLLVRPFSFYEFYLAQFMGYKLLTGLVSFGAPIIAILVLGYPLDWSRLLPMLALVYYYLIFVHTLSFLVATMAFKLTKVDSFTVTKNIGLWVLSGELIPLDLLPSGIKNFFLLLPFSNAVYIPVAYLTGRIEADLLLQGFATTTLGILVVGALSYWSWKRGLLTYSGIGA